MYAVSFLKEAPAKEDSRTIVGFLAAATESSEAQEAGLQDFVQNGAYWLELISFTLQALDGSQCN